MVGARIMIRYGNTQLHLKCEPGHGDGVGCVLFGDSIVHFYGY